MPIKSDQFQLRQRNAAIRRTFQDYLHSGVPRMTAYAKTAGDFYLSEDRIREIIAKRRI